MTSSMCSRAIRSASSSSATMGIPSGYSGPASEGGYERSSMPGIWAAVKAHDPRRVVVAEHSVEVVELAASCAQHHYTTLSIGHGPILRRVCKHR